MSDDFDKDDLDWLRGDDDSSQGPAEDDLTFDWQQTQKEPGDQAGKPRLGVTGQLSWLQPADDAEGSGDSTPGEPTFDWQQPKGETRSDQPRLGVTGQLSWLQPDAPDDFEQQLDDALKDQDIVLPPTSGLRGLVQAAPPPPPDEAADELPPWMQGMDMLDADAPDLPDFDMPDTGMLTADFDAPEDFSDEELPAWMTGKLFDDDDDGDYDNNEVEKGAAFAAQPTPASDDVPDWMRGAAFDDDDDGDYDNNEVEKGAAFAAQPTPASGDVPDWMRGAAFDDDDDGDYDNNEEEKGAVFAAQPTPASDDVPDWMRGAAFDDDDDGNEEQEEEQEEDQGQAAPIAAAAWDAMPDWMRAMPIAEAAEDDDTYHDEDNDADALPDWMRAATAEAEADSDDFVTEVAAFEDVALGRSMFDTPAFDDDLDDIFMQDAAAETDDLDDDIDINAVPDWLQNAAPAEAVAAPQAEDSDLARLFGELDDDALVEESEDVDALFGGALFDTRADDDALAESDEVIAESERDEDPFGSIFDDFDLLPDAADVAADFGDDEMDLDALFGDDESETVQPAAIRSFQIAADDDSADVDIDALLGPDLTPAQPAAAPDDFLSWFEAQQQPNTAANTPTTDDLTWLEDIDTDDLVLASETDLDIDFTPEQPDDDFMKLLGLDDEDALALGTPQPSGAPAQSFADVDAFLASLETGEIPALPLDEPVLQDDFSLDDLFTEYDATAPEPTPSVPLNADAPDWLAGLSRAVGEGLSAAAIVRQQKDRPLDELPERLRLLHERGLDLPVTSDSDSVRAVTPTLPPGDLLPTVRVDTPLLAGSAMLTAQQQTHVALLASLVGTQTETEAEAEAAPVRARLPLARLAASLLLVLAVVLPFFIDALRVGELPPAQFSAGSRQQAFVDQINALPPGGRVLVAAEYAPTGAAELDALTEVMLRHLLARGLTPVIVGGSPTGLLHAGEIADRIAGDTFLRGRDYVVGRYLAGDAVGLRTFAVNVAAFTGTDIQGRSTGLDITALDDFAALVLIAERSESARVWLEQIVPLTEAPLLIASGAAAAPLIAPYLDANAPLLIGYQDAYTYRTVLAMTFGGLIIPPTQTPEATLEATPETTPETAPEATTEAELPTDEPAALPTERPTEAPTEPPTQTPVPSPTPTATERPTATQTPIPSATPTATPEPIVFGVVTSNQRINVRSGPSTSEIAVASLAPNARVRVIGQNADGSWYQVVTEDNIEGWVTAALLRLEVEAAPGTPGGKQPARTVPRQQVTPEQTAEATAEATALVLGELPPVPALDAAAAAALTEDSAAAYQDERWYAMTLGLIAAIGIIILGTLVSIGAAIGRGLARRRAA